MKIQVILTFHNIFTLLTSTLSNEDAIFTDYCQPGLCKNMGGDEAHSGCKHKIPHNGKFQQPPCPEDAAIIELTDSDKQDILDFHNVQRNFVACGGLYKEYGLGPGCRHGVVTWDKELEKTAFLHTSYCTFAHDKCRNTIKYPYSGQNLGLLTYKVKPKNATSYINVISYLWYLEYTYTKMDMITRYYHQTQWMVGHFLTSLNERNNRIGCSFAKFFSNEANENVVMLSCNYPTTNIAKGSIYNSCKVPASQCTTGTDSKYKFLCSSKEKYDVSGRLKLIQYDGDGTEVYDNCGSVPELFHYGREGAEDVRMLHEAQYPNKSMPERITLKKPPTKAPTKKPTTFEANEGNPAAGGIPDYTEDDYDPPDSSVVARCQCCLYQNIFLILIIWSTLLLFAHFY